MKENKLIWIFFVGLLLFYLSWSPSTIIGMGYIRETTDAANQLLSNLGDWLRLRHSSGPVPWGRNGFFDVLFELPFLFISRLFFGSSPEWDNRILALQPVITATLICTIVFVWTRRLTNSLVWGYVLALVTALSTMLWPYAYMGMELTQGLFLLLSGFLALGGDERRNWPRVIAFAVSCGIAISAKSNSSCLGLAILFLVWCYFWNKPADSEQRKDWRKIVAVISIIGACWLSGAYTRSLSRVWGYGSFNYYKFWLVNELADALFNIWNFFFSLNKGLLIFCPVVILCLLAIKKAYATQPRIVIFVGLILLGLIAGFAPLNLWAEETWGPRYLLSSIAPLMICLAASRQEVPFRWRKELPLIVLAVSGFFIAFLGAFFNYGLMPGAAGKAGQNTLEAYHSDLNWNHIRFHWKLLSVWVRRVPQGVETWPPPPHWWFNKPPDAPVWKTADLREFVIPQPKLVRGWSVDFQGADRLIWIFTMVLMPVAIFLLAWLSYLVRKADTQNSSDDLPVHTESSEPQS